MEKPCIEVAQTPARFTADSDTDEECPPSDVTLSCTVYGPDARPDGFTVLKPEWNQLLARSRFNTIFLTHEWQTTWWQTLGEGDLWILAFRQPSTGELVGIVPLYLRRNREGPQAGKNSLYLVGCIEVSDYLDAIVVRGWEEQVYTGLLNWLCSARAPRWDLLDLCNLPEESLTYRNLPPILRRAGLTVKVFQEDVAPCVVLPYRYADYLRDRVDKKQRHEIRRKQRRAERTADVGFYFVGPGHHLEREMNEFIALQQMSGPDKEQFMTPQMQRFFKALARCMFNAGYLRLCFLTLNGRRAATYLAFEYDRQLLLYNSGYNVDDLAHLSPGWVLLAYMIQHSIATGHRLFDFLQGDEEYKYRFGGIDRKVMRVIVTRDSRFSGGIVGFEEEPSA